MPGKFACNGGKSTPDLEKLSCVFSWLSTNYRRRRAAEFAADCRGKIAPAGELPRTSGRKNRSIAPCRSGDRGTRTRGGDGRTPWRRAWLAWRRGGAVARSKLIRLIIRMTGDTIALSGNLGWTRERTVARRRPFKSPALAITTLSLSFILHGANPLHAQAPFQPGGMTQPGAAQPGGMTQPGAAQPGGMTQPGAAQPGGMTQPGAAQPGGAPQLGAPYQPPASCPPPHISPVQPISPASAGRIGRVAGQRCPAPSISPATSPAPAPLFRLVGRLSRARHLLPAIVNFTPRCSQRVGRGGKLTKCAPPRSAALFLAMGDGCVRADCPRITRRTGCRLEVGPRLCGLRIADVGCEEFDIAAKLAAEIGDDARHDIGRPQGRGMISIF